MKILLTGGSGRLGTELQKLRKFDYVPTSKEMDITDPVSVGAYLLTKKVSLIVHCAAYTDVVKAETDRTTCYKVNCIGTENLFQWDARLLYISSEYAAKPVNFYSHTKREGEEYADKVLRLLFKPRPFPYKKAYTDQWTSGDYVDVIAKEVNLAIDLYEHLPRITNIGTGRKSIYELAKQTRLDVQPMSRLDVVGVTLPEDTSADISEWERIKKEYL